MKYEKLSDWALQSRFIFYWIHVACIPKIRPLVKRTVKAIASRLYVSRKSVSPDADYLDYQEGVKRWRRRPFFPPFVGKETFYTPDLPRSARAFGISIDIYLAKCLFIQKYTHAYTHAYTHTHTHTHTHTYTLSLSPSIDNAHNSIAAGRNACDISTYIPAFSILISDAHRHEIVIN